MFIFFPQLKWVRKSKINLASTLGDTGFAFVAQLASYKEQKMEKEGSREQSVSQKQAAEYNTKLKKKNCQMVRGHSERLYLRSD